MTKKREEQGNNPFSEDITEQNEEQKVEQATKEDAEETTEEVAEVSSKEKEELEKLKAQYIRLAADFDNYRKRQAQERESLLKYGAEETLKKLLPVLDTFERAQKSIESVEDAQQLRESFTVVNKQFNDSLEVIGVKKIETVGCEFNPNLHEAVMQTPTNDHPDHSIIQEMQSGYMIGDRVLRAALVNVAVNE